MGQAGGGLQGWPEEARAAPGQTRPVPVDLLQDTAMSFSHTGGTSGRTFKKGQKKKATQAEEGGTKGVRNSLVNTKVRKEGRGGDAPVTGADIPLELRFPCRPWKVWKTPCGRDYGTSRNFPAACEHDQIGAGGYFLKEPQPGECMLAQVLLTGTVAPLERTHTGAGRKHSQGGRGTTACSTVVKISEINIWCKKLLNQCNPALVSSSSCYQ